MTLSKRRSATIMVVALAVLAAALTGDGYAAGTAAGSPRDAAVQVKKKCKRVKKKVHGRVHTVRVCKKTKPRPTLPSKVTVTLDPAHAATASITSNSGATLTSGKATLTVPAGAVADTTTVTITPVTRVHGLKGNVLGAFQLQPDGLQLLKPLTLKIDVRSGSGLEAFSYAGNGSSFRLYPLQVEGGKATLQIYHFSGYGVGTGLPPPSVRIVRAWVNLARTAIQFAKLNPTIGNFALAVRTYASALLAWGDLPRALQSKYDFGFDVLKEELAVALRRLADAEHERCVAHHDIVLSGKVITLAVKLVEPFTGPPQDAASYALSQRQKCERFELDFDSEITLKTDAGDIVSNVRVEDLQLNAGDAWTNQAPLFYSSFSIPAPGSPCSVDLGTRSDTPFRAELGSVLDWYDGGNPPKISMKVDVGKATEIIKVICPGATTTLETRSWEAGISTLHGALGWTIGDWQYTGQSPFARRIYDGRGNNFSEHTTFTLRHTPE